MLQDAFPKNTRGGPLALGTGDFQIVAEHSGFSGTFVAAQKLQILNQIQASSARFWDGAAHAGSLRGGGIDERRRNMELTSGTGHWFSASHRWLLQCGCNRRSPA